MSTIDRLEAEGKFPGRIRLEPTNRVAWLRREVTGYLRHLAKRRQSAAKEDHVRIRNLSAARRKAGRPRRISPLIQITNSRLPARHQGETQMSEDDSGLLVSNQLVGNDQPIQGVIHRGQLALVRLEQNQTWQDWCAVIKALAKGREICRQASGGHDKGKRFNEAMGRWLRCYGFDRIDKSDRSRLLRCADHLEVHRYLALRTAALRAT